MAEKMAGLARHWRAILARYGQDVIVFPKSGDEGAETRAFVQPLAERGEDQRVPSPLGLRREDKFLYLGPGTVPLEEGGRVDLGQERYMVQAAHSIGPGLFWQGGPAAHGRGEGELNWNWSISPRPWRTISPPGERRP